MDPDSPRAAWSRSAIAVVVGVVVAGCGSSSPVAVRPEGGASPEVREAREVREAPDASQAEAMLALLRAAGRGAVTPAQIDAVMAAPGTALIVSQQNASRRVTAEQVRATYAQAASTSPPALTASPRDGERGERGVRGLRDDVWPSLRWGLEHTDVLAQRIAEATRIADPAAVRTLAMAWLPPATPPPAVRLHVVMGGRAGAAAIERDIYVDVLATSFRASRGVLNYPTASELTAFFAHEAHHVGLAPVIAAARQARTLGDADGRAFDVLAMLVTEGSATYFINADHDLATMQRDPSFADHLADRGKLIARCEQLVAAVADGSLAGEAYEKALAPLVASGFHSAGAVLLDAIYRAAGRDAIMAVLRDPRTLLQAYRSAAATLGARGEQLPPVAAALAERLAHLGE